MRDDLQIFYKTLGSKDLNQNQSCTLVFITGITGTHLDWIEIASKFTDSYNIVLVDNRGAGKSSDPPEAYEIDDMADDVICLLNYLGIEKYCLIGISM